MLRRMAQAKRGRTAAVLLDEGKDDERGRWMHKGYNVLMGQS
jgi:hypothetical protein